MLIYFTFFIYPKSSNIKDVKVRSKLLKQQEQIQFDIVKEINSKIDKLNQKKSDLKTNFDNYFEKQKKLSNE